MFNPFKKQHVGKIIMGKYCESLNCWCNNHGIHRGKHVKGLYCEDISCWCSNNPSYHDHQQKMWLEKDVDPTDLSNAYDFFLNKDDEDEE